MKKTNKIIIILSGVLLVGIATGIIIKDLLQTAYYNKIDSYPTIGTLIIVKDFINVREQPTTKAEKVFEVVKDEQYDIIDTFTEEGKMYTWYMIVYEGRRVGWIASYNNEPWVEIIGAQ